MPRVKIDYIVSFSSEDPDNQASNLLSSEVTKRRWLCRAGEPSCSVVLQLERSVQISAVHVGAHHAALVEVLVGRSETPNELFQVLVPSCVFVGPAESRREPVDRVRSFTAEQLTAAAGQRWDRLRLVCSQPYNKHCKYGLSFVHVYSPEEPRAAPSPSPRAVPSPALAPSPSPRRSSSDEESYRPGQLFAKARAADTGTQIRQATSQVLKNLSHSSTKLVKTPIAKQKTKQANDGDEASTSDRGRASLVYTADDERPHGKIDRVVDRHKQDKDKHEQHKKQTGDRHTSDNGNRGHKQKDDDKIKQSDKPERRSDDRRDHSRHKGQGKTTTPPVDKDDTKNVEPKRETAKKRARSTDKHDSGASPLRPGPVSSAPHTLLDDVGVVLSGYQNPRRSQLRNTALALGARVLPAWGPGATHLICAFPNTPKLRSARAASGGRAAAARGEWLTEMAARRRRLPWQWFATDARDLVAAPPAWDEPARASSPDDNDTDDEIEKVIREQKRARRDSAGASRDHDGGDDHDRGDDRDGGRNRDDVDDRDDVDGRDSADDSGDTTRLDDLDTDVEDVPPLPDLFSNCTFVIEEDAAKSEAGRLLPRYILAYGGLVLPGSVEDNEHVDYVVCARGQGGRGEGGLPQRVTADWLWRCHEARTLLPPGGG